MASATGLVGARAGLRPVGGCGPLALGARQRGDLVGACPTRARRGAGERGVEVVLEQGQALEAGDVRDRSVDVANLLTALRPVAEQVDPQRVHLLLALHPGTDGRPEVVE